MSDQIYGRPDPFPTDCPEPRCAAPGCPDAVPASRRKYCDLHGKEASKLRKREIRRDDARAYRIACGQGLNPASPHLKGWRSREAYNEYYRQAMRASRARRNAARGRTCGPTYAA